MIEIAPLEYNCTFPVIKLPLAKMPLTPIALKLNRFPELVIESILLPFVWKVNNAFALLIDNTPKLLIVLVFVIPMPFPAVNGKRFTVLVLVMDMPVPGLRGNKLITFDDEIPMPVPAVYAVLELDPASL